jgi:hypothetical protein
VGATERQFKDSIAPALVGMLDSKVLPVGVLRSPSMNKSELLVNAFSC